MSLTIVDTSVQSSLNPPLQGRVKRYHPDVHIGEVAKRAGVSVKTIRYYERIGVLDEPRRLASGYRDYESDVVERLRFIRASQSSGLRLGEIRGIVALRDRNESPCAHVLALLIRRGEEIDQQTVDLRRARDTIDHLVARAQGLETRDCTPSSVCHLITTTTELTNPVVKDARRE